MSIQYNVQRFGKRLQKLVVGEKMGPFLAIFHPCGSESHKMIVFIMGQPSAEWCDGAMQAASAKVLQGVKDGYIKVANQVPNISGTEVIDLSKLPDRN